jgi:ABC-type antimicrobial peptide transport system permease subunit
MARQALRAMNEYRAERLATPRFAAAVVVGFALLALTLATVGVYGTVSYLTAVRRQEIGVRLALGASRGSVFGLVVTQALRPVAFGVVGGLALALAAGSAMRPWLYDVTPTDLPTLSAVCLLLVAAAFAAAVPPARRATRVDPAQTLRATD